MFTAENAAEMGRRGNKAREEKKLSRKALSADPSLEALEADNFRKIRLLRARKMLDKLDEKIFAELDAEETDAAALDRLASAALRFNEQERQLSNRSLPPTLKANQAKPPRRATSSDSPEPAE
jgi:hypothetical protein